jgi:effector-binding domain-containing protein
MNFFKRSLLVLAVLIGVYLIAGLLMNGSMHIERSMVIKADATTVFNEINTLKNWKSWSYWDNIDTAMKSVYEGPESSVGCLHRWQSTHERVGNGSLKITKSESGKFVETELSFEGMGSSLGGWKLKDTTGGILATTYMDIEMPFYARPMTLFMNMDEMLGTDFNKSLEGLRKRCEAIVAICGGTKIELSTQPAMKLMTVRDSCDKKQISMKLGQLYGEIGAEMTKQGLKQNGAPFGIYHVVKTNGDSSMFFVFEAGIPVDKSGLSSGRVNYSEFKEFRAVRAYHYGQYSETPGTHEKVEKWMSAYKLTCTGPVWEMYVTDPMTEADPGKWLTELVYPY